MNQFVQVLWRGLIGVLCAHLLLILGLGANPVVLLFVLAWVVGVLANKFRYPWGRLLLLLCLGVVIAAETIIMFSLVLAALAMSVESLELGASLLLFAGLFVALLNYHCQSFASVRRRRHSPDRWACIEARIPLGPHEIVVEPSRRTTNDSQLRSGR